MSNSSLPSLDPVIKEYLNQFGELMMNRFDNRVNQLIEHLATPTPPGNNVGGVDEDIQVGANGQNENLPNGGTANPVGQHHQQGLQAEPQPLHRPGEAIP